MYNGNQVDCHSSEIASGFYGETDDCFEQCDACIQVYKVEELSWSKVRLPKNHSELKYCLVCADCADAWK